MSDHSCSIARDDNRWWGGTPARCRAWWRVPLARRAPRGRSQRSPGATQYAALGLLLLLLGNLTLTTLTHDWIGLLPQHDHLLLGARGMGLVHHAHRGDPLARAFGALRSVAGHEERQVTAPTGGAGVLSLQGYTGLQPEMNTHTASGLLAAIVLWPLSRRGVRCLLPLFLPHHGCSPPPLLTPPRAA